MLWRKQRSRSPPRLTSSIPELEQYLAALDTPLPDSADDNADAYATAAEYLQAPAPSTQGQTAASSSASDDQVVPDTAGPQDTIMLEAGLPASPLKDVKTLKLKMKLKIPRAKAQYSQPCFLTLVACVSYLSFHLMGINIGLRVLQGYTEPRLQRAEVQLKTTQQALAVDCLLDMQLSNLHHATLQRSYKEIRYEDCLVRGLNRANLAFGGLDFTSNPHIRNQTADWVTSNCDRLFYTPQVHSLMESKLRVSIEEIRSSIKELLRLVQHRLMLLQTKVRAENPRLAAKFPVMDLITKNAKRSRVLPDVPYGFSLECKDQARCHLVHAGQTTPAKTVKTLRDAITDARKEVEKWSYNFERIFRGVHFLIEALAWLQLLCIGKYLLFTAISMRRHFPKPEPKLTFAEKKARVWKFICFRAAHVEPQEKHAIGLLINTALYALLGYQLEYIIPEFDRLLLPIGLGFCVFHTLYALGFIDPAFGEYPDESLHDVARALEELCLIAHGIEPTEAAPKNASTPKPKASPPARPASKIAARFISPLTPIAVDLQQERKAMHAEQGKPLDDADELSGYVPETDEEIDSDVEHGSYVDLAGGVTPTDSEDDELVLVEG
ncbi:DNA N-glycosylase and apurinic/apyrimidinic (AP) lyase [Didymella keratinophila]|nr:DNA N-glycosylase and apurinic/apyrimidinic (AP) lyase [Didymella keratinophila]